MLAGAPTPTPSVLCGRLLNAAGALGLVLVLGYSVTIITELAYWTASGIVALVWYPTTAVFGDGALRRTLTIARLRGRPLPHVTSVSSMAENLIPLRNVVEKPVGNSAAESLIVEPGAHALPTSSAQIH